MNEKQFEYVCKICNKHYIGIRAFSNHIAATAVACELAGLKSIGIIRGEETSASNPTLSSAKQHGMELLFVSRTEYSQKSDNDYLQRLRYIFWLKKIKASSTPTVVEINEEQNQHLDTYSEVKNQISDDEKVRVFELIKKVKLNISINQIFIN